MNGGYVVVFTIYLPQVPDETHAREVTDWIGSLWQA